MFIHSNNSFWSDRSILLSRSHMKHWKVSHQSFGRLVCTSGTSHQIIERQVDNWPNPYIAQLCHFQRRREKLPKWPTQIGEIFSPIFCLVEEILNPKQSGKKNFSENGAKINFFCKPIVWPIKICARMAIRQWKNLTTIWLTIWEKNKKNY